MIQIKAPVLGSAKYGKDVKQVMENIDANFTELVNGGFSKGDRGNSVKLVTINLSEHPGIIQDIKSAIQLTFESNSNVPGSINGVTVWDHFNNPGNMTFVYEDGKDEPIASLPYIFKDLRFEQMKYMASVNELETNYDREVDWSGVVYYSDGEYKLVQEFPTLYYDDGFKWKVNGVQTGLFAQGPQGLQGESGEIKIVTVEQVSGSGYRIANVYYEGIPVQVSGSGSTGNHRENCEKLGVYVNTTVMAMVWNNTNNENDTYLSTVYEINGEMMVSCSSENRILSTIPISSNDISKLWDEVLNEE